VFTLGSSAVHDARDFFTQSIAAVQKLGRRAVLVTGRETGNELPKHLPPRIAAFDYLPFSEIFPQTPPSCTRAALEPPGTRCGPVVLCW
jgi:rhamnosyltransferase subunit B